MSKVGYESLNGSAREHGRDWEAGKSNDQDRRDQVTEGAGAFAAALAIEVPIFIMMASAPAPSE